MKGEGFPPRKTPTHPHETASGVSVDVIVKAKGVKHLAVGRYFHELGEWQIDHFSGYHEVTEWWPMPTEGTGFKPCDAQLKGRE